jgi:Secretion system C-terminal sorting domain
MKIFYILLSLIVLTTAQAKAQNNTVTSAQDPVEVKHVKFYPNPATSLINFEFQKENNTTSYSFQVFNFLGKKVYELTNVTQKTTISVADFPRGIYIFQLKDQNGRIIESDRFQVVK